MIDRLFEGTPLADRYAVYHDPWRDVYVVYDTVTSAAAEPLSPWSLTRGEHVAREALVDRIRSLQNPYEVMAQAT